MNEHEHKSFDRLSCTQYPHGAEIKQQQNQGPDTPERRKRAALVHFGERNERGCTEGKQADLIEGSNPHTDSRSHVLATCLQISSGKADLLGVELCSDPLRKAMTLGNTWLGLCQCINFETFQRLP